MEKRVVDAIASLEEPFRTTLILRYYDELGIDDIAETLGISRNSVKSHLTRGMRALESRVASSAESVEPT